MPSPARLELCRVDPDDLGGETAAPEAGSWALWGRREPPLAELLEDPLMALLWRSDGLDPAAARATVRALQVRVRNRDRRVRHERPEASTEGCDRAAA